MGSKYSGTLLKLSISNARNKPHFMQTRLNVQAMLKSSTGHETLSIYLCTVN